MNLMQLLAESHSKAQRDRIIDYVGSSKQRFAMLIKLFLKGPYRITQRASSSISYCIQLHPQLIQPYLKTIVSRLSEEDLPVAVKRNIVRLLQFVPIPRSLQGLVATSCFTFLRNPKETIAVKVFSMTVLANIAKKQPEILNELKILMEDQMPYAGAGFIARARKLVQQME